MIKTMQYKIRTLQNYFKTKHRKYKFMLHIFSEYALLIKTMFNSVWCICISKSIICAVLRGVAIPGRLLDERVADDESN